MQDQPLPTKSRASSSASGYFVTSLVLFGIAFILFLIGGSPSDESDWGMRLEYEFFARAIFVGATLLLLIALIVAATSSKPK